MQYNKRYLIQDILIFVLVSHFLLLGIFFICDSGALTPERFVINAQKVQSTIVFVPLKKRIVQQPMVVQDHQKKSLGKPKIIDYNTYQKKLEKKAKNKKKMVAAPEQKTPVIMPAVQPVVQKVVQQIQPKKTAATSLVQEIVKKPQVKKIIEKVAVKKEVKKTVPGKQQPVAKVAPIKKIVEPVKKVESIKKVEPVKKVIEPVVEKVTPVPPVIQDKIITPVVQEQVVQDLVIDVITKNLETLVTDHQSQVVQKDKNQDDQDLDNVTFVGSYDLEMLEIQEHIKTQVGQYYKPPVGISKKAVCELSVVVGLAGKAQRVTVKKSSGSMANDMCARAALLKITFPKRVVGKEIIVELGQ